MTRDDFQAAMWASFLHFAYGHDGMRAQFTDATGRALSAPASPLEAMIDKATGKDDDDAMAFMIWATRSYWGWEESPESFRADAEAWEAGNTLEVSPCR